MAIAWNKKESQIEKLLREHGAMTNAEINPPTEEEIKRLKDLADKLIE